MVHPARSLPFGGGLSGHLPVAFTRLGKRMGCAGCTTSAGSDPHAAVSLCRVSQVPSSSRCVGWLLACNPVGGIGHHAHVYHYSLPVVEFGLLLRPRNTSLAQYIET